MKKELFKDFINCNDWTHRNLEFKRFKEQSKLYVVILTYIIRVNPST